MGNRQLRDEDIETKFPYDPPKIEILGKLGDLTQGGISGTLPDVEGFISI